MPPKHSVAELQPSGVLSGPKDYSVAPLLSTKGDPSAPRWQPPTPLNATPSVGQDSVGLLGGSFLDQPLYKRLDWLHVPLLIGTPLIALYGCSQWTFDWRTLAFAVAFYFFSGLGITAGECWQAGLGSGSRGRGGQRSCALLPGAPGVIPLPLGSSCAVVGSLACLSCPWAHPSCLTPPTPTPTHAPPCRLPPLLCAQGLQGHATL
jgi:hypothetical protein